jgi:hypothetical protein
MIFKIAYNLLVGLFICVFYSCKKESAPQVPVDKGQIVTSQSSNYIVSTFAGSGVAGAADGDGPDAQFRWLDHTKHTPEIRWGPNSLSLDPSGNLYVADAGNFSIRKITPSGFVTTVAGGREGTADGIGRNAQFSQVNAVIADSVGDVYVAEKTRVRKISSSGDVATLAGGLNAGYFNGNGLAARFDDIAAMTFDRDGNIVVCDRYLDSTHIRKITRDGIVSTFFGIGSGSDYYTSIIMDRSDNFYMACIGSYGEPSIVMLTPSKVRTKTVTGKFFPRALAINTIGEIYVLGFRDNSGPFYTNIYQMVTPLEYIAISDNKPMGFADGPGNVAKYESARGIAADERGNVYVGDPENFRVRKIRKQ